MEKKSIYGLILLGSIWGSLEATLGAILHMFAPFEPYVGAVMFSIGAAIMSFGLGMCRPKNTVKFTFGIGVIASLLKGFDLFLLGPIPQVINPMTAIVIEALAFGAVVSLTQRQQAAEKSPGVASSLLMGYASHMSFSLFFAYVMRSEYWLAKGLGGIVKFVMTSGTISALLCVLTAPSGFVLGATSREPISRFFARKPFVAYSLSATLLVACWILGIGYG